MTKSRKHTVVKRIVKQAKMAPKRAAQTVASNVGKLSKAKVKFL